MSLQLSDLARNADGSFPDIGAEDWERWISEHPEVLQSEMIEGNRIITSQDYRDRSFSSQGKRDEPAE